MKIRFSYKNGQTKELFIEELDIIPVPKEFPNEPLTFHINKISEDKVSILSTSNLIPEVAEVDKIDFIE